MTRPCTRPSQRHQGLQITAASTYGRGEKIPAGPRGHQDTHPGLTSLWWACLRRCTGNEKTETPDDAEVHN